jgi:hypothetical protein
MLFEYWRYHLVNIITLRSTAIMLITYLTCCSLAALVAWTTLLCHDRVLPLLHLPSLVKGKVLREIVHGENKIRRVIRLPQTYSVTTVTVIVIWWCQFALKILQNITISWNFCIIPKTFTYIKTLCRVEGYDFKLNIYHLSGLSFQNIAIFIFLNKNNLNAISLKYVYTNKAHKGIK